MTGNKFSALEEFDDAEWPGIRTTLRERKEGEAFKLPPPVVAIEPKKPILPARENIPEWVKCYKCEGHIKRPHSCDSVCTYHFLWSRGLAKQKCSYGDGSCHMIHPASLEDVVDHYFEDRAGNIVKIDSCYERGDAFNVSVIGRFSGSVFVEYLLREEGLRFVTDVVRFANLKYWTECIDPLD